MATQQKRYKLKLNSIEKIEELLQEAYNEACKNIVEAQDQINRITTSVQLNEESLDAKTKYAKAMNDFILTKDKQISQKIAIAKLMNEICKSQGNMDDTNGIKYMTETLNLEEIRHALEEESANESKETKEYRLK